MFCTSCGTQLKPSAKFCTACGQATGQQTTSPTGQVKPLVDPADIARAVKTGRAVAGGLGQGLVKLGKHLRRVIPWVGLGLLLLLFLTDMREVDLLVGSALLLAAVLRRWRCSIGAITGALLYCITFLVAKVIGGELGGLFEEAWNARPMYWLAGKVAVAVVVILEATSLIRFTKWFDTVLVGLAVYVILFAFPGYEVGAELQRRHTFTPAELALVKGLIRDQEGRRFIPISGVGPRDTIEVLPSKVYTNRYGVAKLKHAVRISRQVHVAELLVPYDRIALPDPVEYINGGTRVDITYKGPDTILVIHPQVNGNSAPTLAISEGLLRTQRAAVTAALEAHHAVRADSLNKVVSEQKVLVQGGYCMEHCFLLVLDVESKLATELYFPMNLIPGGDIELFVEQVMKDGRPWQLTSHWTVLRSKNEEGIDEWTDREEVVALERLGKRKEKPAQAPSVKREKAVSARQPNTSIDRVPLEVTPAEYPGGQGAMNKFISTHMQYPRAAREAGLSGVVGVTVTIQEDGRISDPMIFRSKGPELDMEALRIVGQMPNWTPAMSKGRAMVSKEQVSVRFTIR